MTMSLIPPSTPWGDRTALLPKKMIYTLSLDVLAQANGPSLVVQSSTDAAFRHLFDEVVVTMPEGLRCDLPDGTVVSGDGEIGSATDPASSNLRLRVTTKVESSGLIDIECLGVVNFHGGPDAFRSPNTKTLGGSAFIATYHETESATFRWLTRRQLFGVGRVKGWTEKSGERLLAFSFDLYAAS